MVVFAFVLYMILAPAIALLMLLQALIVLVSGTPNTHLRTFHFGLGNYALQILRFLLFITETKPFPFSRFSVLKTDDSVQGGTGISATGAPIPDYGQYDRPTILRNKKKKSRGVVAEKGLSSAPDILDSVEVHESIGPEAESSSDVDATLLEALSQELDK